MTMPKPKAKKRPETLVLEYRHAIERCLTEIGCVLYELRLDAIERDTLIAWRRRLQRMGDAIDAVLGTSA